MKTLFEQERRKLTQESSGWNNWRYDDFEEGEKVQVQRDGPNGHTWVKATVIKVHPSGITVKWDEKRPILCPTETLRIPRIFLFKNYIRKMNPYSESEGYQGHVLFNESTANFKPMLDGFPLIACEDPMNKVCPECGHGQDPQNDKCEICDCDLREVEPETDEYEVDGLTYEMMQCAKNANDAQDFYEVSLEPGYYEGIQFYVTPKYDDVTSWSDEDAQIQFGVDTVEEVLELKQMSREIVLKVLKQAKKNLGLVELKVGARFSNGETMYDRVDEHSSITCDGCGREVHDDTVEIVGNKVLCDRCRRQ